MTSSWVTPRRFCICVVSSRSKYLLNSPLPPALFWSMLSTCWIDLNTHLLTLIPSQVPRATNTSGALEAIAKPLPSTTFRNSPSADKSDILSLRTLSISRSSISRFAMRYGSSSIQQRISNLRAYARSRCAWARMSFPRCSLMTLQSCGAALECQPPWLHWRSLRVLTA